MRRRGQIHRIAKSTGLALCIVLAVAWIASFLFKLQFHTTRSADTLYVVVGDGEVLVRYYRESAAGGGQSANGAWSLTLERLALFDPDFWPGYSANRSGFYLEFPGWIPLALVAIPTAFVLWRTSRIPPGHCRECGYNLTGNVSGRCPECGQGV